MQRVFGPVKANHHSLDDEEKEEEEEVGKKKYATGLGASFPPPKSPISPVDFFRQYPALKKRLLLILSGCVGQELASIRAWRQPSLKTDDASPSPGTWPSHDATPFNESSRSPPSLAPCLLPGLLLLSRLSDCLVHRCQSSSASFSVKHSDMREFLPLLRRCLASPIMKIRSLAAQTLAPLIGYHPSSWPRLVRKLTGSRLGGNQVHGTLLLLKCILRYHVTMKGTISSSVLLCSLNSLIASSHVTRVVYRHHFLAHSVLWDALFIAARPHSRDDLEVGLDQPALLGWVSTQIREYVAYPREDRAQPGFWRAYQSAMALWGALIPPVADDVGSAISLLEELSAKGEIDFLSLGGPVWNALHGPADWNDLLEYVLPHLARVLAQGAATSPWPMVPILRLTLQWLRAVPDLPEHCGASCGQLVEALKSMMKAASSEEMILLCGQVASLMQSKSSRLVAESGFWRLFVARVAESVSTRSGSSSAITLAQILGNHLDPGLHDSSFTRAETIQGWLLLDRVAERNSPLKFTAWLKRKGIVKKLGKKASEWADDDSGNSVLDFMVELLGSPWPWELFDTLVHRLLDPFFRLLSRARDGLGVTRMALPTEPGTFQSRSGFSGLSVEEEEDEGRDIIRVGRALRNSWQKIAPSCQAEIRELGRRFYADRNAVLRAAYSQLTSSSAFPPDGDDDHEDIRHFSCDNFHSLSMFLKNLEKSSESTPPLEASERVGFQCLQFYKNPALASRQEKGWLRLRMFYDALFD